ncbi:MAG TPA: hypothetical protein DER60_06250 [Syntrophomonas sp.]|nr:hypothetical protein [Syntrophomonas sp.]
MTKVQIDRMQYFLLIPNLLFPKAIGITAGVTARRVGGDAWTAMAIGFAAGTLMLLLIVFLSSRFSKLTIIGIVEQVIGKWPGKLAGLMLAAFFSLGFAVSANVMTLHLKEYFLIETPFLVICLIYILLCMYGVILGIENIIRYALLGFLGCLLINVTMIFGTIGDFEMINLLPLFDRGIVDNLAASIYVFGDLALAAMAIGMIFPMLNDNNKAGRLTFWAMAVSAVIIITWPVLELGVMGAGAMEQYVVVCMQQIRCAQLTRFLPRYELIMVFFFTFSTFVQSATLYFCAMYSIKQISGIKKDWYIVVPLSLVLVPITYFMAKDHNNYVNFLDYPWAQICLAVSLGLPLLLFVMALFSGKLMTASSANNSTGS